ncbi:MAG TPA: dihydroneopterin aldolase [Gaiellales bacterium]|nr:dihydroneopterin aldolase [Gaiellales bacterium]
MSAPPVIELRGLRVFAHHGVLPQERRDGQTFVVDLDLRCARSAMAESDRLADAVDYSAVADRVVQVAQGGPYDLIERLAAVIADDLMERFAVSGVRVRVSKPEAPILHPLAEVAVVVERG